ncbi:MAG: ATP-dependent Clp protease proteolytic subunit [Candidatus Bathyarchaeia archaeon]
MDISELFLGFGLIAVSALNSAAVIYLVRQAKGATREREGPKEDQEDTGEEEAQHDAAPDLERPTTKAEILAWRQRIIEGLERERGTKVITMIHKKELWTEPGEDPEIGIEDTVKVLMEIQKTPPNKPIDMIIHTPGGYAVAAQMMAMAIKFHPAKVTVMIPFYAMSGGSLMSLAAGEIRMEKYSVLGPVDPQIPTPGGMHPAGALATLMKTKPIQTISDKMVILAESGNLEVENAKAFVMWLLEGKMDEQQAERVADFLARGYMSHATPITLDVARTLGLNVVEGVPDKVYELFKTFAFTGQSYKGR